MLWRSRAFLQHQCTHGKARYPITQTRNPKLLKKEEPMSQTGATQHGSVQAADKNAIRPFHVDIPEAELTDLRRRINATRWPERETVSDQSQGVQLATTQNLASYWANKYDWRKCEAKLNALPNFITEI